MKRSGRKVLEVLAVIGAIVTTVTVGLVATTASAKPDQDVTLTVSLFGDFGYHDLYKKYEKAHPGVTIKESIQDFGTHHTQLAQRIAAGRAPPTSRRSRSAISRSSRRSRRTSSTCASTERPR